MSLRLRRMSPVLMGVIGLALLAIGLPRLPAEIIDVPGNAAADALADGAYVNIEGAELVVETRTESLKRDPNARRWFALARARMVAGNATASADAFEEGLFLAPANGVVWAEYARALKISGRQAKAEKALALSIRHAPHDPRARRIRRSYGEVRK